LFNFVESFLVWTMKHGIIEKGEIEKIGKESSIGYNASTAVDKHGDIGI